MGVILLKQHGHFINFLDPSLLRSFISIALALLFSFLVYLHLFWYFERGKHPEILDSYRKAIKSGLWAHTIKNGFISMPTTVYGKFTVLFWLLCTSLFFASFNASVTSTFTVALAKQYDSIKTFGDLSQLHLAVVEGSAVASLASDQGLTLTYTKNLEQATSLLQETQVGGVLYDSVIAQQYLARHHLTKLMMSGFIFGQEEYAFAVPYHSRITQALNMTLVE